MLKSSRTFGVQYIPFERDNIRATFGDVLKAVIRREFGATKVEER